MSLLEKAERMRLDGSGWSLGHDPKSGKIKQTKNLNYFL